MGSFPIGAELVEVKEKKGLMSHIKTYVLVFSYPMTGERVEVKVWAISP